MLNRKRHQNRNQKENKNNSRNKKNKNERVTLDLSLKQKKKQNIAKEKNVKERRKKEINNTSIHNNEDLNDNQSMESQINTEGNYIDNKRSKSAENLTRKITENISIIPNKCDIFNKLELFNSLLLIINNISLIKNYFSKDKVFELIKKCEKNDKYSLSSISYYIGKYLWSTNNKKIISQKKLLEKYKKCTEVYSLVV